MTYPSDAEGRTCGWDLPDHPILYYASHDDPVKLKFTFRSKDSVSVSAL